MLLEDRRDAAALQKADCDRPVPNCSTGGPQRTKPDGPRSIRRRLIRGRAGSVARRSAVRVEMQPEVADDQVQGREPEVARPTMVRWPGGTRS